MFRRATLAGLVVASLAFAGPSGTARASGAQVIQERFHGPFAEAGWEASTPTSATEADTLISQEQNGTTHLNIHEYATYLDSRGNVTGSVEISGALVGVEMTFDTVGLTTASASGRVPVTRCTFDAAGNQTGCTNGTLDVSETWTGQGPITRGIEYVDRSIQPGDVTYIDRGSGTFRSASATATIGGQTFDGSKLQFADFGVSNDLTLTVCPHGC
jgi:hypothetical protein